MNEVAIRIRLLERELADLEQRMPAHSVPAAMVMRVEEIEAELAQLRAQAEGSC